MGCVGWVGPVLIRCNIGRGLHPLYSLVCFAATARRRLRLGICLMMVRRERRKAGLVAQHLFDFELPEKELFFFQELHYQGSSRCEPPFSLSVNYFRFLLFDSSSQLLPIFHPVDNRTISRFYHSIFLNVSLLPHHINEPPRGCDCGSAATRLGGHVAASSNSKCANAHVHADITTRASTATATTH